MIVELGQGEQKEVLHRDDDGIGVGRGCECEVRVGGLLGDDGCGLYEEGLAAVRSKTMLDEVEEAAWISTLLNQKWSCTLTAS